MRLSNSSVLGFSTFGAVGPSPPPPLGAGTGIRGFCNRSDISVVKPIVESCKFQAQQVIHGTGLVNHFEAVFDLLRVKQVAQIELNGSLGAAQEQVIPLGGLHAAAEFLNTPATHRRAGAGGRAQTMRG